jgi:ribA/ribD-fused uncharacterized protein
MMDMPTPLPGISCFADKYFFLSNFYPAKVKLDDLDYPTIEHAYQAAKTTSKVLRIGIRNQKTPGKAKREGRKLNHSGLVRRDWYQVNLGIMEDLIRQKFTVYPELRVMLLETGTAPLQEGNTWGDDFFGVIWDGTKWVGENHLGKILMKIREELRDKK